MNIRVNISLVGLYCEIIYILISYFMVIDDRVNKCKYYTSDFTKVVRTCRNLSIDMRVLRNVI